MSDFCLKKKIQCLFFKKIPNLGAKTILEILQNEKKSKCIRQMRHWGKKNVGDAR